MLGLGNKLGKTSLVTPGIVTDNLVLKHNYDAGAVVPVSDGAASFDGSNAEINCGSDSSLDVGTNQFTAMCWFYPNTVTGDGHLIGKGSGLSGSPYDNKGWSVTIYSGTSKVYFDVYAGSSPGVRLTAVNTTALTANKWYHIAVCRTTNGAHSVYQMYINGVHENNATATDGGTYDLLAADGTINDASNDFTIGENSSSSLDFDGYICNVGYWTTSLSQAQIKSIMWKNYAGLTDSEKTNLVSWWNLDSIATGSDGSYVRDYHYGGNSSELGSEIYTTNNALSSQPYEADDDSTNITLNSALATTVFTPTANIGKFSLKLSLINATNDRMSTSFSTTSGKLYEISFYMKFSSGIYNTAEHGATETYSFKVGTSDNDATNASIALLDIFTLSYGSLTSSTTDWYNYKVRFKASASTSHFTFIKTDALGASLSTFIYFDDFSVKEVIGNPGDLK